LHRLGRLHEAQAHFRLAIQADYKHAQACNELGTVLRQSGLHAEALQSYAAATAIKPDFAEAFSNLGNVLLDAGRVAEAEAACRRATQLAPALPEAHFNLGNVLRATHQTDEAAFAYRQAVALRPGYAAAWCNLGLTVQAFDRSEAEACCRRALQADPNLPQALVFLADIMSDQGSFDEAEALLQRAIAIAPDMAAAWAGLALLRKMTEADRPWLDKAERIVAGNLTSQEAAHLQFAIGKFLDDLKDYDRAFAHYQRANALSKHFTPPYVAAAEAKAVDDLCARYTANFFIARSQGQESMVPVFVVGMPRSGTSLTEQIIAAHPQAFGAGELPFWQLAAHELEPVPPADFEARLQKFSGDYLATLHNMAPQASRVVDKMPGNFRHIGLIHAAFPQARFIHMQRDPVDTCLSIYFQHFGAAHAYANDLHSLAHYYLQYRRLMAHWQAVIEPGRILELAYEDLVATQETCTRRLLDFIGLPWSDACLNFHTARTSVGTASKWQVRQRMNKNSVARWRHYEDYIAPLLALQ
jgi:tetratricopeptide (TPR) repeat protein